ncbi:MAG: hypothetical protein A2Y03_03100 [Omnitrophica WOR_2 bacterium GWF2_38_59]|nr:MAG: hypothetical protein A2Y06_05970 [Omnitrophica WOR_2 bacterium GWA2_37_7]OGX26475.1 MAG: hypothetical protein A2Y03_03100 [Omnitrophica WOR_2 bacterium GWF2_38_59]OGX49289.1 MAG: hypothetical protein A2243_08735 [Omnitrophica WOR_2 bacterium RIFOXYA2_FULL_38_17]OGX54695.1 MAG: hypothetical protein A2267_09595 [Omnitrophica WOR_2 bacterium RIFOXYA12_FULL_38_10]OGX55873.1 MAG: hypothetical protein A2447_04190 [Omnitrophica WOR_2 bacterium RIFOXYC2_FULL_38_12]OGX58213.1 MAG: hypothetical 
MIKIDINIAISVFLSLSILLVFTVWLFYNYKRSSILSEINELEQCPYCAHIFPKDKDSELKNCPQCKSYLSS